MRTRLSYWYR